MRILKLVFVMVFFSLCLLFLVQNYDVLRTNFQLTFSLPGLYEWNPTTEIPYYFLLIGSFAVGMFLCISVFFLSSLGAILQSIKNAGKIRALEAQNKKILAELTALQEKNKPAEQLNTPEIKID